MQGRSFALRHEKLDWDEICNSLASWIDEALSLPLKGMPRDSFSLVFDGGPRTAQTVFDMVKQMAIFQDAREECFTRGLLHYTEGERRREWYISEGFPAAISDIVKGTSFISFEDALTGRPWDVSDILVGRDALSFQQWDESVAKSCSLPGGSRAGRALVA
ncbi:hypothetical protein BDV96DRAFT_664958 [Lophiotrema nucula]|uniref:Uncharacterized protein n=1 Tax=Lophiotrema nucula TaxID=690887 RepID=A0A6A5YXT1_9PLEO|nr:hypothetical protein BDV96DRAFT_664958 [Lophiotrema nucula]